jgi:AbrB family looped-hinge helix DNA binding protein
MRFIENRSPHSSKNVGSSTTIPNFLMEKLTSISSKRQVTIPKPMRQALGLEVGDKVGLEVKQGNLILHPVKQTLKLAKYRGVR